MKRKCRHYFKKMKNYFILFLLVFLSQACSFKNISDPNAFTASACRLKGLILNEYRESVYGLQVRAMKNPELKKQLRLNGIDELSVQYDSDKGKNNLFGMLPGQVGAQDSLIIFSKVRVNKVNVHTTWQIYETIVYFLSEKSRKKIYGGFDTLNGWRMNDSIWLQKNKLITITSVD
ncbi:MAG: hypothetical protein JWQ27_3330 [Ferruginibacter sp.]|nr:hypothetical protein [Ferruginibacter sp.]